MSESFNRREFLHTSGAGALALSMFNPLRATLPVYAAPADLPPVNVHVIYLAKPVPTWPTPYLDVQAEIRRVDTELRKVANDYPEIKLTGGELLRVADDLKKLDGKMDDADGVLIFNLTSTVGHLVAGIAEHNIPSMLFSQPYSGHDWCRIGDMQRDGKRIDVLATSDFQDLAKALRAFRTIRRMKDSRILCLTGGGMDEAFADEVKEKLGTEIILVSGQQLMDAFEKADLDRSKKLAADFIDHAETVVEPTKEEILKSCRLYHAMCDMLQEQKAQAIAINCLGLFRQGELPAYPCLGFSRLNDEGLVGACEADLQSTLTMLTFGYLVEKPGFISDPVIDTSENVVIHAHCVSATRMDGVNGKQCPYAIRSHMEDDKGAALQVKMDIGQTITMARYLGTDTMLISTGEIVDTPVCERGCRTKITTKVNDPREVLRKYTGGLHRVIFYGDHVNDIYRLSHFLGFNVVEEC